MLGAAFLGALVFGRIADKIGRTRVYWMSAALMVVAAIGSALAPSLTVLVVFRFLLGFGVGGEPFDVLEKGRASIPPGRVGVDDLRAERGREIHPSTEGLVRPGLTQVEVRGERKTPKAAPL